MIQLTVDNLPIWFHHGKPVDEVITPCSNWLKFRTINKARKMARKIIDKYPTAIVIIGRYISPKKVRTETWSKRK